MDDISDANEEIVHIEKKVSKKQGKTKEKASEKEVQKEDQNDQVLTPLSEAIPSPKKVKVNKEYVMTPARAASLEKMKEARAKKVSAINDAKTKQNELVKHLLLSEAKDQEESQKKETKPKQKKTKQVIVLDSDSSDEEENQIVIRRKRRTAVPLSEAKTPQVEVIVSEEKAPEIFRLRRLR